MALSSRWISRASSIRIGARPNSCAALIPPQRCSSDQGISCLGLPPTRFLSNSSVLRTAEDSKEEQTQDQNPDGNTSRRKPYVVHPVETSIRYMKSNAYRRAYGDDPVWTLYRRNFKGQFAPPTRKSCLHKNHHSTGSPCPVCRDEYLVVDYRNPALLEQFISPYTGQTLTTKKTGVCQKVQFKLELEIMKAHDYGTLQFEVPFREYDYEDFYPQLKATREPYSADSP
ncbi:28S ribosomal protein S18b, mitochondrial [Galendromus occidentalis]|uniref:Small ribosomal subunit protein mS40 n=1 Tax=Galendromus occidentalis TaxID=34638 RepID=A0AAJ6QTN9_9ACAR|nr:28S ribosomal protein S18b, mitochondrial [Galendromus occidentalis]